MDEQKKAALEKKENRLEIVIAIFLAVTALCTAWASWIGSLHGGNQATNYTMSNNSASEGNASWNEASQTMMQDMLLWNSIGDLQYDIFFESDKEDTEGLEKACFKLYSICVENLSERMAAQIGFDVDAACEAEDVVDFITTWMESEEAVTSPFSDQEFIDAYFEDSLAVLDESQQLLEDGKKDNANGDAFGLVTVFYSVILFLLGIAGTFKRLPNRRIIVIVAIIGFIAATVYMFTLPMPTGFDFLSYFK